MTIESPRFAVLKASGINRDEATKAALERAGAQADIIRLKQLASGDVSLSRYQGLIIPGGFSFGDDIGAGVVLAAHLNHGLADQLLELAYHRKRPIVGICNGFQALVGLGLLPFGEVVPRSFLSASLTFNASGKFESRWIYVKPQQSVSQFVSEDKPMTFPVAHGEGRFVAESATIDFLQKHNQIVWQYCDPHGDPTQEYPENPNGSAIAIAGICDPTGIVFGAMPHPEDYIIYEHNPNWRRTAKHATPDGLKFFKGIVMYARES